MARCWGVHAVSGSLLIGMIGHARPHRRRHPGIGAWSWWTACAVVLVAVCASRAKAAAASSEYDVKAAFVLNFIRLTEWPDGALSNPSLPLTITVLGDSPIATALEAAASKPVKGHTLLVRRVATLNDIGSCHVLFIAEAASSLAAAAVRAAGASGVLTISESSEGDTPDAVISFFLDNSRVGFDVNRDAAARAGMELSTRLLGVARHVHGGQGKP